MTDSAVQAKVVEMYERRPFPSVADPFRKTAEEMELRLKLLGLTPQDYQGKSVLDVGCGTGEYTSWYASRGARVTGIDLSRTSLERAKAYALSYGLSNVAFERMSALDLRFPDNSFDLTYSMGVLHHTTNPFQGFCEMVRVTRPGGIVIVSVYNKFGRLRHNCKQKWINFMAGDDTGRRVALAKLWFPGTCRRLKRRMRSESDTILYDAFGIPHESQHSIGEILGWFARKRLTYTGAFGPVTIRDVLFAAGLPEFASFEPSLEAFPLSRMAGRTLRGAARLVRARNGAHPFKPPSILSRALIQTAWFVLGFRFSIFSLAGRKEQ